MPGRRLRSDEEVVGQRFGSPGAAQRRRVLHETIKAFEEASPPDRYHRLAEANLRRWRAEHNAVSAAPRVQVIPGDWGVVTAALTRAHGECFAVLNMANAHVPGGAYVEGARAQEENLFRRTDAHFRIGPDEFDERTEKYLPELTRLLSARDGRVLLDVARPRVCIRGPEALSSPALGYEWLADEDVFPFFELRAAAQDLRDGVPFDPVDGRMRIAAQLDTLRDHGVRHAVLSAFGCGAFHNPAHEVAPLYRDEIAARERDFDVIAFAILAAGYGPDNYAPFAAVFEPAAP